MYVWVGLLERKKKITDQYAEEKKWVFSFDLRECRQMPDRDRKRVPDHRSNVLRGSKVVFLRVHVGFLFTTEEQKKRWFVTYSILLTHMLAVRHGLLGNSFNTQGCVFTTFSHHRHGLLGNNFNSVFSQLLAITDMNYWAKILTLCFLNF